MTAYDGFVDWPLLFNHLGDDDISARFMEQLLSDGTQ